jgi:hypothetical protein
MEPKNLSQKIEELKTDKKELGEVLQKYDLDESLEGEFNQIDKAFQRLEIQYQSLKNARRFLNNG